MAEDSLATADTRPEERPAAGRGKGRKALLATVAVLAAVLLVEVLVLVLRTPHRWEVELVLGGPDASFLAAAWSPDGRRVLTVSRKEVTVWDAASGKVVRTFQYPGRVPFALWSPDGEKILACGGDDGRNLCWDASSGERIFEFQSELQRAGPLGVSAQFSPEGTMIVTAGADHVARIRDARTGGPLRSLEGHSAELAGVYFSPDGRKIATLSRNRVWKEVTVGNLKRWETVRGADPTCRIWDAATGECLSVMRFDEDREPLVAAWSLEGQQISMWGLGGSALVWDANTGELVGELKDDHREAGLVVYSPDGTQIASTSLHGRSYLLLWDAETLQLDSVLVGHVMAEVGGLAYSPDSRFLCSAGCFETEYDVRVWDTRTGECVGVLKGREGMPESAAFSSDGRRILTTELGGPAIIWKP